MNTHRHTSYNAKHDFFLLLLGAGLSFLIWNDCPPLPMEMVGEGTMSVPELELHPARKYSEIVDNFILSTRYLIMLFSVSFPDILLPGIQTL